MFFSPFRKAPPMVLAKGCPFRRVAILYNETTGSQTPDLQGWLAGLTIRDLPRQSQF
jgi:hypothetical protein